MFKDAAQVNRRTIKMVTTTTITNVTLDVTGGCAVAGPPEKEVDADVAAGRQPAGVGSSHRLRSGSCAARTEEEARRPAT